MLYQNAGGVDGEELSSPRHCISASPAPFPKGMQHPLQHKCVSMGHTQQRSRWSSYTGRLKWASGTSLVPSWTQPTRRLWLNLRLDARCQQMSQLVLLLGDQAIIDDVVSELASLRFLSRNSQLCSSPYTPNLLEAMSPCVSLCGYRTMSTLSSVTPKCCCISRRLWRITQADQARHIGTHRSW